MRRAFIQPAIPAGLAFEVADLILLESWAAVHELRMNVSLDYCDGDGEYEEMVSICARDDVVRWLLWRAGEIIVQPMIGRRIRCPSVAEALKRLSSQL